MSLSDLTLFRISSQKAGGFPGAIEGASMFVLGLLVFLPVGCSILYCIAAGFGLFDPVGEAGFTLRHYEALWNRGDLSASILFSVGITVVGTALSYILSLLLAITIRTSSVWNRISRFLVQIPLPFPHQIAAIFVILFFAQSGLLSRLLGATGVLSGQESFPALVFDEYGIGIMLAYLWKEIPFLTVVMLAILSGIEAEYEEVARSLGAGKFQRFRHILLPTVTRGALPNIILLGAFIFGAFEVPLMVGSLYPPMVSVLTLQRLEAADITQRGEAFALGTIVAVIIGLAGYAYVMVRRRTDDR